jgi:hypothetical protein
VYLQKKLEKESNMKILFICGSLAPGRDGVGDYTRRFAGELIRQGHHASIIALNDQLVDSITDTTQETDGIDVQVLRIPAKLSAKVRFAHAGSYIEEYNPEWLSLQYVPFSFQKKGLPWGLGSRLAKIAKGRKWHVMFHELWIGMNTEVTCKFKVWGIIQREITRSILKQLHPVVIHTQTKLYQFELFNLGYNAIYLPLFGNIPVLNKQDKDGKPTKLSFVVFGGIHYGAPIAEFAKQARIYAITNNIEIEVIFIGRCGAELESWIQICKTEGLRVSVLGEQSPMILSEVLSQSNIGITSTPFLLVEKSGTVAAMLEHGLSVICVARQWTVAGFSNDNIQSNVKLFNMSVFSHDSTLNSNSEQHNTVSNVTRQLIESLTKKK